MATKELTDERLKEIAALPVTYDDDIPEFSDSGLKGFAPAHPEYLITSNLFQKNILHLL